jgi:hypothetical protein
MPGFLFAVEFFSRSIDRSGAEDFKTLLSSSPSQRGNQLSYRRIDLCLEPKGLIEGCDNAAIVLQLTEG